MAKLTPETYLIVKGWFQGGLNELDALISAKKVDPEIFGPVVAELKLVFSEWEIRRATELKNGRG